MNWKALGISTATLAFLALIIFKAFTYYQYYKIFSREHKKGIHKITYKEYEKYRRQMEGHIKK